MAEAMLGKKLHPDRVISVEKLYEIFNECEIPYRFAAQYGIENNSFAVVRCKDCKHWKEGYGMQGTCYHFNDETDDDDFCSYGEREENG